MGKGAVPADPSGANPWLRRLPLLVAAHAVGTSNSIAVLSMAPVISRAFGLSATEFGLFVSFYYGGQAVFSVPAGGITDRLGVGWTLVLGHAVMATAALVLSLAPDYSACLGAAFLMGTGYSMSNPSTAKGVNDWFPANRRGTAMGIKQVGVPIGGLIGAGCGALAASMNWQSIMVGVAVLIAVNGIACLTLVPVSVRGRGAGKNILAVVRDKNVHAFSIGAGVVNIGQTNFYAFLTLFLAKALGLMQEQVSAAMAVAQTSSFVGRLGWGAISDRAFGGRRLVTMSAICAAAVLFLASMPAVAGHWGPAGAGLALGFGLALCLGLTIASFAPVAQAIQVEMVEPRLAGAAVGYNMLWTHICATLAPIIFGAATDHLGGFRFGWWTTAAIVALGTAMLVFWVREGRTGAAAD